MEFKIDTKPNYTILIPLSNTFDANLTEALRQKWKELTESGSGNFIIDLTNCIHPDENAFEKIIKLHEEIYTQNKSLVFINITLELLRLLKEKKVNLLLNVAPSLVEAIDIISMEMLERDLFNEES